MAAPLLLAKSTGGPVLGIHRPYGHILAPSRHAVILISGTTAPTARSTVLGTHRRSSSCTADLDCIPVPHSVPLPLIVRTVKSSKLPNPVEAVPIIVNRQCESAECPSSECSADAAYEVETPNDNTAPKRHADESFAPPVDTSLAAPREHLTEPCARPIDTVVEEPLQHSSTIEKETSGMPTETGTEKDDTTVGSIDNESRPHGVESSTVLTTVMRFVHLYNSKNMQ